MKPRELFELWNIVDSRELEQSGILESIRQAPSLGG